MQCWIPPPPREGRTQLRHCLAPTIAVVDKTAVPTRAVGRGGLAGDSRPLAPPPPIVVRADAEARGVPRREKPHAPRPVVRRGPHMDDSLPQMTWPRVPEEFVAAPP
jgi:hypothetical protein